MAHAPIYRAAEHHKPAPVLPLRRGASLVSAAVALTLGGIALGYHGLSETSVDASQAPRSVNASIALPVPGITFPSVEGGHPDLLAQLSESLLTHLQPAVALTLPVAPAPPAPMPTLEPIVVSVDVGLLVEVTPEANLSVPDDTAVMPRRVLRAASQVDARVAAPAPLEAVQAVQAPTAAAADEEMVAAAVAQATAAPARPQAATAAPVQSSAVVHQAAPAPKSVVKAPTPEPEPVRKEAEPVKQPKPQAVEQPKPQPQASTPKEDTPKQDSPAKENPKPQPQNDKPSPKSKGNGG